MAEEHAGLFSIPTVPSSARLSSERGTRKEEKMMALRRHFLASSLSLKTVSSASLGQCV